MAIARLERPHAGVVDSNAVNKNLSASISCHASSNGVRRRIVDLCHWLFEV